MLTLCEIIFISPIQNYTRPDYDHISLTYGIVPGLKPLKPLLVFPSTGLEKNESIPIPKLEQPRQPNAKEQEHAVEITIGASNDVRIV